VWQVETAKCALRNEIPDPPSPGRLCYIVKRYTAECGCATLTGGGRALSKQRNQAPELEAASHKVLTCTDLAARTQQVEVVQERPLTIFLNDRELVTLLTDFSYPRELAVGFLRNEGLVERYRRPPAVMYRHPEACCRRRA